MSIKGFYLQILDDYGHLEKAGIKPEEKATLTFDDPRVEVAIKSMQEIMGKEPTGKLADALAQDLFTTERCGEPDFDPRAQAAIGSGSWPSNCDPKYPGIHVFKVKIDTSGMPAFLRPIFEAVWQRVVKAYANIGLLILRDDKATSYNTLITFESLAGSTIGLAIVPRGPRCGDRIWAKYDPGYKPSDLFNQWCRLIAHELGHNQGLNHTNGGIMNPSIVNGEFTEDAWRNDRSFATLEQYYGGQPVKLPDDPNPPTPPTGDVVWIDGEAVVRQGDKVLGKFVFTPSTEA